MIAELLDDIVSRLFNQSQKMLHLRQHNKIEIGPFAIQAAGIGAFKLWANFAKKSGIRMKSEFLTPSMDKKRPCPSAEDAVAEPHLYEIFSKKLSRTELCLYLYAILVSVF